MKSFGREDLLDEDFRLLCFERVDGFGDGIGVRSDFRDISGIETDRSIFCVTEFSKAFILSI